jgi:hypothetical protein
MVAIDSPQDRFDAGTPQFEPGVSRCSIFARNGKVLAAGEAHLARDGSHMVATVQGLTPVGALMLAIFGRGQTHFVLEIPGYGPLQVELTASRWLAGQRICFFRSQLPVPAATFPAA